MMTVESLCASIAKQTQRVTGAIHLRRSQTVHDLLLGLAPIDQIASMRLSLIPQFIRSLCLRTAAFPVANSFLFISSFPSVVEPFGAMSFDTSASGDDAKSFVG